MCLELMDYIVCVEWSEMNTAREQYSILRERRSNTHGYVSGEKQSRIQHASVDPTDRSVNHVKPLLVEDSVSVILCKHTRTACLVTNILLCWSKKTATCSSDCCSSSRAHCVFCSVNFVICFSVPAFRDEK